jgi:hypothetical protein
MSCASMQSILLPHLILPTAPYMVCSSDLSIYFFSIERSF